MILNDLLPLYRLPINKAPAIMPSSCLTDPFEGIRGQVEDCFLLFEGSLEASSFLLQLGGFSLQLGVFSFIVYKKETNLLDS